MVGYRKMLSSQGAIVQEGVLLLWLNFGYIGKEKHTAFIVVLEGS